MPKINKEEYEKIKLLPDYDWNWIAREKTGKILSFTNKPTKTDEVWKDEQTRLWFNYKDSQLFQFIQWEDEEPYEIAELIREYEIKELRIAPSGTVIVDSYDESEETEVLSQEWIDEHRKSYTMEDSVEISDLQNLLVPEQEELESKIKVLIEAYKQEEDAYSNPENGWISGFIEDLKNLVEEEQKYHVRDENDTLLCKSNGVVMTVGKLWAIGNEHEAEYDLTEQEIKDYDERYWSFAKKVEELEE